MTTSGSHDKVLFSPVFIIGAERSGTTWLQRIFLSHPDVIGGQESQFFLVTNHLLLSARGNDLEDEPRRVGLSHYWDMDDMYAEVRNLWRKTFLSLAEQKPSATLLVEKTPGHCLMIETIREVLPHARFIHIIRDSRAVVASMLAASRDWGKIWAPASTKRALRKWFKYVESGREAGRKLPADAYTEVNYEQLKLSPHDEIRRLFTFGGLQCSEQELARIIEENTFGRQTKTAFKSADGKEYSEPAGFNRKGEADGWKKDLNTYQQLLVWRHTRHLMRECGYGWDGFSPQAPESKANA